MGEPRIHRRFRTVSELRTQFICEYRLYLEQIHGNAESEWSEKGRKLHQELSVLPKESTSSNIVMQLLVISLIILFGILWILG